MLVFFCSRVECTESRSCITSNVLEIDGELDVCLVGRKKMEFLDKLQIIYLKKTYFWKLMDTMSLLNLMKILI